MTVLKAETAGLEDFKFYKVWNFNMGVKLDSG